MGEIIREYVPFPDPGAPIKRIFFRFRFNARFYITLPHKVIPYFCKSS